MHHQRPFAPHARLIPEQLLDLVERRKAPYRQRQLSPRPLVAAQHVPLPNPRSPPRPRPAIDQTDRHPPRRELVCAGAPDDPRPHHQHIERAQRENPAGNGSSGSSTYCPIPVIHARPVISGTTAGNPPTDVSATIRPPKRVPITDRFTNSSPTPSSPRACSAASLADVPVPHGERSSQPGWIDVALRCERGPSSPGAVKITCLQPTIRSSAGCAGGSAALIAAMTSRPRSMISPLRAGSTASPADEAGKNAEKVPPKGML